MTEKITIALSIEELNQLRIAAIERVEKIEHQIRMSEYAPTRRETWEAQLPAAKEAVAKLARTQQARMDAIGAGR